MRNDRQRWSSMAGGVPCLATAVMKLVTWNVNSLKARAKFVADYLDEIQPDVLCLQELKLEDADVPVEMFEERGYEVAIHGQRQWNGVLIASKQPITNVVTGLPDGDDGQSRLIACEIGDLKLVNLYCPQGQSEDSPKFQYKLRFFKALREWMGANYSPADNLLVVGDINIAPLKTDVWDVGEWKNVPTYHPKEHKEWKALLKFGLGGRRASRTSSRASSRSGTTADPTSATTRACASTTCSAPRASPLG